MDIKFDNKQSPGKLFHAVGQDWKGRFTLILLRNKVDEARMVVDRIIPYMLHYNLVEALTLFDPEVVIKKEY